jgi:hypothetical protein
MSRTAIALLCASVALAGLAVATEATFRVARHERALGALAEASRAEGRSFVETLQGHHAERQRIALDTRRALALSLARARRDRLLGAVAVAGAALAALGLRVLARIAGEVEEDRRHVRAEPAGRGPDRP